MSASELFSQTKAEVLNNLGRMIHDLSYEIKPVIEYMSAKTFID